MENTEQKTYGKIASALVAAQSEFPSIPKNAQGYGYKYATLDDILTIVKPILHKNGLAITQLLEQDASTSNRGLNCPRFRKART